MFAAFRGSLVGVSLLRDAMLSSCVSLLVQSGRASRGLCCRCSTSQQALHTA